MAVVRTETVNGKRVAIECDSLGVFRATIGDNDLEAKTLADLVAKVKRAGRRLKRRVEIPAVFLTGPIHLVRGEHGDSNNRSFETERVTITGKHETRDSVLYRDALGKAGSRQMWEQVALRGLSAEEMADLGARIAAFEGARYALAEFVAKTKIDVRDAFRADDDGGDEARES